MRLPDHPNPLRKVMVLAIEDRFLSRFRINPELDNRDLASLGNFGWRHHIAVTEPANMAMACYPLQHQREFEKRQAKPIRDFRSTKSLCVL